MGEADLMSAALLLDVGTYFVGLVRPVYAHPERAFLELPFEGTTGPAFCRDDEVLQPAAERAGQKPHRARRLRQATTPVGVNSTTASCPIFASRN